MQRTLSVEISHPSKISYEDIDIVKPLNKSKYEVYLCQAKGTKSLFAMKVYPYSDQSQLPSSFKRELRLKELNHTNIISIYDAQKDRDSILHGKQIKVAYILMELAPYGDFADILINNHFPSKDTVLVRTYFHQLISGMEYLHSKKMAHLDLKLENLLLGKGYTLKIADFDCCHFEGDTQIFTRGTNNFRAPEVKEKKCKNPQAADVYSAGIILFALKAGVLPYIEDMLVKGHNLHDLLRGEDPTFFDVHNECRDSPVEYDKPFRKLFLSMIKSDPSKRFSIDEIKESEWYQGPVYTQKELQFIFAQMKNFTTIVNKKSKS